MVLELKNYKKNFNSLLLSSFFNKNIYKNYNNLIVFFVIKNSSKYKIVFFFIVVSILLGKLPYILKNNLKKKNLGFLCRLKESLLSNLVLVYLPTLPYVICDEFFVVGRKSFLVFENYPFNFEVDTLCERNSRFIDYFLNYKLVCFFNFRYDCIKYNEALLRCIFKMPIYLKNSV